MKRALVAGVAMALFAGCATVTPPPAKDPAYEPTYPATAVPPHSANGAIYQSHTSVSLFEDVKAHRVGDTLTIELTEKTDAAKKASTSSSKEQSVGIEGPTILGRPVLLGGKEVFDTSVSASREFAGDGASSQSNQLSGSITVTVAQVLPNGNLVVRGQKLLALNQGDEFIRIQGIVRPVDITAQNTVPSTKVANAEITYGGRGAIDDSNRMGWLARFFNSWVWPF